MAESQISNKIWNIAGVLRDGGVSYGDYLEQITFLLFLKMVDENKKMAKIDPDLQMFSMEGMDMPDYFDWNQLAVLQGESLLDYYEKLLSDLSKRKGMIGEIYRGARNKVEKASLLKKVVDMIDAVDWSSQSEDVKGDIYESLLQRIAQDTKSGAGQYFTPRALINVIVKCVNPKFNEDTKIADPCCGSGGFLLAARNYFGNVQSEKLNKALQETVFHGTEYVESTYRMCLMNLLLHGIGTFNGVPPIKCQDSLAHAPGDGDLCDYILTNPPFGKKSSQTIEVEKTDKEGNTITVLEKEKDSYTRQDFIATTSNKQLNFVQHIKSMLRVGGQAAVVLPDNVLFEGNAGEVIRQNILKTCDLHTILRLPSGLFYAQGVKANVVFFEKRPASETIHTKEVWIYDYRTNIHHTLKQNPLKESDLDDFVACYNPTDRHKRTETYNAETNPEGRWRKFTYDEIIKRDKTSLNISWIKSKDPNDNDLTINERFQYINDFMSIIKKYNMDVELLNLSPAKAYEEILDMALHGLLVEQDDNDEPATTLLSKIAETKLALIKAKKIKKQLVSSVPIEGSFDLPKGWCWVNINLINQHSGKTMDPSKNKDVDFELYSVPVFDSGMPEMLKGAEIGSSKQIVEKGDVLLSKINPHLNRVWNVSHHDKNRVCIASSEWVIVRCPQIESLYLKYIMSSTYFLKLMMSNLTGVGGSLTRAQGNCVREYPIPLPPVEEQKRIIKRLQEILPILEILK